MSHSIYVPNKTAQFNLLSKRNSDSTWKPFSGGTRLEWRQMTGIANCKKTDRPDLDQETFNLNVGPGACLPSL